MEVPVEFIAQYKYMLGNHVVVRDPVGGEFTFQLVVGNNGGLLIDVVDKFVKRYDLKRNHWVDFSYCGKNKFSIRIFDRMMNQISYGAGPSVRQPDVGSSGKNGEEVVVSDVGDKDEVGGEVSVPVADVGDKDEDGVEVPVPVADVGGEIPVADVGGQFMDVDNIEENDVIMISSDDEEDDGIVQLSDEEEDDGIMQLSDGEEDDGVERVIHNFDKVISSSDSGGGQTMVSTCF